MIIKPIESKHYRITQGWGENFTYKGKRMYGVGGWIPAWQYHLGIDFTSRENMWGSVKPLPIRAGVDGKAEMVVHTGKGNLVIITGQEYMCEYMHLDSFEGGSRGVKAGDIIGYTGNTGTYTTAPHLHLGVKKVIDGKIITTGGNYGYINFTDLLADIPERDFSKLGVWRGCRVVHVVSINGNEKATAAYNKDRDLIVLAPGFYNLDIEHQEGVLEHETGHRIWHRKMTDLEKKAWTQISNYSITVRIKLILKGKFYKSNFYVNSHAESKVTEDFGETLEMSVRYPDKVYGDYRDIKIEVAKKLFNKYL